mmetsp:Transcript_17716/g.28804  ORF Transcript_17716/g.28804 Transcript_17716/m.28804 type:complete len:162 (-) Transcript_17716:45-530(-)
MEQSQSSEAIDVNLDPVAKISMEDRAFLEEFGTRLSRAAGAASLIGGAAAYGIARHQGWRRRGLCGFFGATICPLVTWYAVVSREKDRVFEVAKRLQFAMEPPPEAARGHSRAASPAHNDAEVLSRLFPPPPTGLQPPGLSSVSPGVVASAQGVRPPGSNF